MRTYLKLLTVALALVSSPAWGNTASLAWDPPTQYEDGTALPLAEISYYKIYYGTASGGPYSSSITVPASATSASVSNLARGTWYFVATTVATNGLESVFSTEASKDIKSNSRPKPPRWKTLP